MNTLNQNTPEVEVTERKKSTVRIYACGGAGVNIASKALEAYKTTFCLREDFPLVEVSFIDTSSSNLAKLTNVKKEDVFLIEGTDGSGQVRSQNLEAIAPRVKWILQAYKPLDLNIIITSLSGGSGSVFSPLIAKELLAKGEKVVVLAIGDETSKLYATNTVNSLKSFESVARQTNSPVIMGYFFNSGSKSKPDVDKFLLNMTFDLCCLFNNQHTGLDTKDLEHFLYYTKVTDHRAALASISLVIGEDAKVVNKNMYSNIGVPITVVSLAPEGGNTDFPRIVDYHTEGTMNPETSKSFYQGEVVHTVITDGVFDAIIADLNSRLAEIQEAKEATLKRDSILRDDDVVDSSGLVL